MRSFTPAFLSACLLLLSATAAQAQDASWDSHLILIRLDNMASYRIERSQGKNDPGKHYCLRITSLVRPDETRMISVKGISPVPVRIYIEPSNPEPAGLGPMIREGGLALKPSDQVCIADLKSCFTSSEEKNTIIIRILPDLPGAPAAFAFCQVIYTLFTN